jgi:glycosyltransferase involved in cell wall biosynthesis
MSMSEEKDAPPVLIVDLAKNFGGAEVRVIDTVQALHGRYPYAVATLAGSPLHRRLEAAALETVPIPFSRSDPRLLFLLRRVIRQNGFKVLDAHNVQSQFWGHLAALLTTKTSRVSTVHSSYKLEHNGSRKGWAYEQVLRLNARWGVHFVAVSEAVAAYLQNIGIAPHQISLIHNSIQLPAATSARRDQALLQNLGWTEQDYVVSVVARLEPVKGHTYLIEAVRQLIPEYPHLRCLIVGEGRTRAALERQIEQANLQAHICLTGFRDDIPALLQASDAFCLPSLSEGLPYALLEACAYRRPLLVTEVGGMAEFLQHQQTGFLVPPGDAAALAEGLRWLMAHPQAVTEMSQRAFSELERHFSPAEMLAKTLAVYR